MKEKSKNQADIYNQRSSSEFKNHRFNKIYSFNKLKVVGPWLWRRSIL